MSWKSSGIRFLNLTGHPVTVKGGGETREGGI